MHARPHTPTHTRPPTHAFPRPHARTHQYSASTSASTLPVTVEMNGRDQPVGPRVSRKARRVFIVSRIGTMREEWKAMLPCTNVVAVPSGKRSFTSLSRASEEASTTDCGELTQATSTSSWPLFVVGGDGWW
jgi:hypothetical protein